MAERTKRCARGITLTERYSELKALRARSVIEAADALTVGIEGSERRSGSFVDGEGFVKFARYLRREISIAQSTNKLRDLDIKLPAHPYLRNAINARTIALKDMNCPTVPGVALLLTPTEDGWDGRFAGESFARRVRVDDSEVKPEDLAFKKAVLASLSATLPKP